MILSILALEFMLLSMLKDPNLMILPNYYEFIVNKSFHININQTVLSDICTQLFF